MQKLPYRNHSRRHFIKQAGLAAAAISVPNCLMRAGTNGSIEEEKLRLIVDADTANEVDDLFAIARAF